MSTLFQWVMSPLRASSAAFASHVVSPPISGFAWLLLFFFLALSAEAAPPQVPALSIKDVSVLVKRLPVLTENNYAEWSFAFQLITFTLGLGSLVYPHLVATAAAPAEDLDAAPDDDPEVAVHKSADKSAEASSSKRKSPRLNLVEENKNDAGRGAQYQRAVVAQPADAAEQAQVKVYLYTVLVSSLSPSLLYLVRSLAYGDLQGAFAAVQSFFQVNNNASRWRLRKDFNELTMQPNEDFLAFCGRIQYLSTQINALSDAEVVTDCDRAMVLTEGVRRHHLRILQIVLQQLGREPNVSFEDAKLRMLPDAHRAKEEAKDAKSTTNHAMVSHDQQRPEVCRNYLRGRCYHGDKCRRQHVQASRSGAGACHFCGKQGHQARNCFLKKKGSNPRDPLRRHHDRNDRNHDRSEAAHLASAEVVEYVLAAYPCPRVAVKDKWTPWEVLLVCVVSALTACIYLLFALVCFFARSTFDWLWSCFPKLFLTIALCLVLGVNICVVASCLLLCFRGSRRKRRHLRRARRTFSTPWSGRRLARRGAHPPRRAVPPRVQRAYPASTEPWQRDTILDSGATSHLFSSTKAFDPKTLKPSDVKIHLAEQDRFIKATHVGTAVIQVCDSSGTRVLRLKNALLVPGIPLDLISLSRLDEVGCKAVSEKGKIRVERHGTHLLSAYLNPDRLYRVSASPVGGKPTREAAHLADSDAGGLPEVDKMHRRLGHCSLKYLQSIAPRFSKSVLSFCDACAQAKSTRRPYKHAHVEDDALKPLDKVTADLCGPMEVKSVSRRKRYFAVMVDVATRYLFVYFLRKKSDFTKVLESWLAYVKTQTGKTPKRFHTDGGTEFTGTATRTLLEKNGVKFTTTSPHEPNMNAFSERINRTLLECALAMMFQAGAPKGFWEQAIKYACYLRVRTPHRFLGMRCPIELFPLPEHQRPIARGEVYKSLRIWGCEAYLHIPKANRKKLSQKSVRCVFVGIDENGLFQLYRLDTKTLCSSRNVVFNEAIYPLRDLPDQVFNAADVGQVSDDDHDAVDLPELDPPSGDEWDSDEEPSDHDEDDPPAAPPRTSNRKWAPSAANLLNISAAADAEAAKVPREPAESEDPDDEVDPAPPSDALRACSPHRSQATRRPPPTKPSPRPTTRRSSQGARRTTIPTLPLRPSKLTQDPTPTVGRKPADPKPMTSKLRVLSRKCLKRKPGATPF